MHLAPQSRRALGLAAAGAIAMSATVFALGGVAQAVGPTQFGSAFDLTVPQGTCAIDFRLQGQVGGSAGGQGGAAATLHFAMPVSGGDVYNLEGRELAGGAAGAGGGAGGAGMGLFVDGDLIAVAGGGGGGGSGNGATGGDVEEWGTDVADPDTTDNEYYAGGDGGAQSSVGAGGAVGSVGNGTAGGNGVAHVGGAGAGPGGGGGGGGLFGGGGGASSGIYGAGGGGGSSLFPDPEYVTGNVQDGTGRGVASAGYEFIACPPLSAPSAPRDLFVSGRDGALDISFTPGSANTQTQSPVTRWLASTDGGTTWAPLSVTPDQYRPADRVGTVTGLVNGTPYAVQVKADSAVGASAATASVTGTPYRQISAPRTLSVARTAGGGLKISWTAAAADGTFGVAGYDVGWNGGEMGGPLCRTAANVLTCDVPAADVPSSTVYRVSVAALDSNGNRGVRSTETTVVTTPATVPTKDGDLVRPAGQSGSVAPGATVRITGSGYAPNSTVTLLVYSEPQVLTTTVADANGNIDVTVTVPAGLAAGNHTLVAAGVDAQGNTHYLTLPITVTGGTTGSGGLAYTGADVAVPALGGLAALAIGGGLVLAGRRKRAAE